MLIAHTKGGKQSDFMRWPVEEEVIATPEAVLSILKAAKKPEKKQDGK